MRQEGEQGSHPKRRRQEREPAARPALLPSAVVRAHAASASESDAPQKSSPHLTRRQRAVRGSQVASVATALLFEEHSPAISEDRASPLPPPPPAIPRPGDSVLFSAGRSPVRYVRGTIESVSGTAQGELQCNVVSSETGAAAWHPATTLIPDIDPPMSQVLACLCACQRAPVCACACVRLFVCLFVCVCVCVRFHVHVHSANAGVRASRPCEPSLPHLALARPDRRPS
jgi:hypothetical protein